MELAQVADAINTLGRFLGRRDVRRLTPRELERRGVHPDVVVLVGGSVLGGADLFARAVKSRIAPVAAIVGGRGHTTDYLRSQVERNLGTPFSPSASEAAMLEAYIRERHHVGADLLETGSTHTSANVANLLLALNERDIACDTIVAINDSTMQLRLDAAFRRQTSSRLVNFAAYRVTVRAADGSLHYDQQVRGMWEVPRYISLLLGEIPRLVDNEVGYGPRGRGYIAHVDTPQAVLDAFGVVRAAYPDLERPIPRTG